MGMPIEEYMNKFDGVSGSLFRDIGIPGQHPGTQSFSINPNQDGRVLEKESGADRLVLN
jgi:hypothetical protein